MKPQHMCRTTTSRTNSFSIPNFEERSPAILTSLRPSKQQRSAAWPLSKRLQPTSPSAACQHIVRPAVSLASIPGVGALPRSLPHHVVLARLQACPARHVGCVVLRPAVQLRGTSRSPSRTRIVPSSASCSAVRTPFSTSHVSFAGSSGSSLNLTSHRSASGAERSPPLNSKTKDENRVVKVLAHYPSVLLLPSPVSLQRTPDPAAGTPPSAVLL